MNMCVVGFLVVFFATNEVVEELKNRRVGVVHFYTQSKKRENQENKVTTKNERELPPTQTNEWENV